MLHKSHNYICEEEEVEEEEKKKLCKHVKTEFCFRKKIYERNENVIENFLYNNLCTPVSKYLKNTKTKIVKISGRLW